MVGGGGLTLVITVTALIVVGGVIIKRDKPQKEQVSIAYSYVCTLSKLHVSEVLHVAQFPFVHNVSCTHSSEP